MTRPPDRTAIATTPHLAVAAMAAALLAGAARAVGWNTAAYLILLAAAYLFGVAATRAAMHRHAARSGGAYIVRLDHEGRRWRVIPEAGTRPVAATRVARVIAAELEHLHPIGHVSIDAPYLDPPDLDPPGAHRTRPHRPPRLSWPSDEDRDR